MIIINACNIHCKICFIVNGDMVICTNLHFEDKNKILLILID
jgi:hypothetical protein